MEAKYARPDSIFHKGLREVMGSVDKSKVSTLADAEKVQHCLSLPGVSHLKVELQTKMTKSLESASAFKEEGNAHFKAGRYLEARDSYTRSILLCPVDYSSPENNVEFAIFLANRSAALEACRMFAACQQDIEMAFKYGYPKHLQYKVRSNQN